MNTIFKYIHDFYAEKVHRADMGTVDRTYEEGFLGSQRQNFLMLSIVQTWKYLRNSELPITDIVIKVTDWPLVCSKLMDKMGVEEVVLSDPFSFMILSIVLKQ